MQFINPFVLSGRRILVTGATSGLGKAIALCCANMGAVVIGIGRDEERLQNTQLDLNAISSKSHRTLRADLTQAVDRESLVAELGGPIDGLVHSAGISRLSPVRMMT